MPFVYVKDCKECCETGKNIVDAGEGVYRMFRKKEKKESYDKEKQKPVIRASICTGEKVAGFRDLKTGKFTEVMLIRDRRDLDEFLKGYHISEADITKEW
jgi:hypothetical protein